MSNKNRKPKSTKRASGTKVQRRAEPPDTRKAVCAVVLHKSREHIGHYRVWLTKQQDAIAKAEEMLQLLVGATVSGKPTPAIVEVLGTAFRALDEHYVRHARGEKYEWDRDTEGDLNSLIDSAVRHIGNAFLEACVLETFRAATVPVLDHRTITARIDELAEKSEKLAMTLERVA